MFVEENQRTDFDEIIQTIADYVVSTPINSNLAYETARYCLMDSLGCAMLALQFKECTKLLGPVVPGMSIELGARVPGTNYELDPVQGAFNFGTMVRWLDFNDTWLAAEWGHPSDNLGAILMMADYASRQLVAKNLAPLTMKNVLTAMIKAHEIQGGLALLNSFNRVGLDHVILVKIASTAVVMHMMGGDRAMIMNALSQAMVDGQSLRTYRHAPNAGSRKSWAAGDATSRAVRLCLFTLLGEKGYPSALTAKNWGFYDVSFKGQQFQLERPFGSYVMENVLFKISFPAEFHAQTAVEAAVRLHPLVASRLDDIDRIELTTHESAVRIISKSGPLHNPADRDHCLQYMVAIGLLFGGLTAEHYEDNIANDPRIDALREKMQVREDKQFSEDYLNPDKRSITNTVQVFFKDGSSTDAINIEYPIGHKRRREEGIPVLEQKFATNLATRFNDAECDRIITACKSLADLEKMAVSDFVDLLVK